MYTRRSLLQLLTAAGATGLFPGDQAHGAAMRTIPQKPGARVIVDNDFAGDPDGLIALAHQLLAPTLLRSWFPSVGMKTARRRIAFS